MEIVISEQLKKFATELEKIKKEIHDINCRREAQDAAFEQELDEKQEESTKIQRRIDGFNISILEAAMPKYFKIKGPYGSEFGIEIYKTEKLFSQDGIFKLSANKLFFYNKKAGEFTLFSKRIPNIILGHNLETALKEISSYEEITNEEYNDSEKKIIELLTNNLQNYGDNKLCSNSET